MALQVLSLGNLNAFASQQVRLGLSKVSMAANVHFSGFSQPGEAVNIAYQPLHAIRTSTFVFVKTARKEGLGRKNYMSSHPRCPCHLRGAWLKRRIERTHQASSWTVGLLTKENQIQESAMNHDCNYHIELSAYPVNAHIYRQS